MNNYINMPPKTHAMYVGQFLTAGCTAGKSRTNIGTVIIVQFKDIIYAIQ